LFLLCLGISQASEEAFTQTAFDKLQAQDAPILISVHAEWCPTCRAQAPVISKLLKKADYQHINALRVDFDQQAAVVKAFNANTQSTLIVFKGKKEQGRSVGDTSEAGIESLLKKIR
jgi:thioredoxin-like negative regulator of GroEL